MRPRKRRRAAAAATSDHEEEEEEAPAPADDAAEQGKQGKQGKWKPVEMDLELMQAFESEGGVFLEETTEAAVMYGDSLIGDEPGAAPERPEAALEQGGRKGKRGKKRQAPEEQAAGASPKQPEAAPPDGKKVGKKKIKAKRRAAAKPPAGAAAPPKEAAPAKSLNFEHGTSGAQEEVSQEALAEKLPAWAPFGLHPLLLAGLLQLQFEKPTEVQARCLTPALLQRKDIVGAAETGSGKTLAFGLPILHHTLSNMDAPGAESAAGGGHLPSAARQLKAVVVLPTRELAVQVQSHLNAVAQRTPLRAQCVVGGMSAHKQRRLLRRRPAIIVGTPGRLSALLGLVKEAEEEKCDWFRDGLRGLRHLVLDEADRLVESGHFKELHGILGLVYESLERTQQLQTLVFSATLTLDPRTPYKRKGGGASESKVDTLMRRMQFRDARAVHVVDLTKPEEVAGKAAPGAAAEQPVAAGNTLGARLPAQLLFRDMTCSSDKDREAFLVFWLLKRYRWDFIRAEGGLKEALRKQGGEPAKEVGEPPKGGRVLLFVNAISSVLRLSSVLAMVLESPSARKVLSRVQMSTCKDEKDKPRVVVDVLGLHSRMKQRDRLRVIERFRTLEHAVLVCTDIAARGLDLPGIAGVIHFHVPRAPEVFVHRSGRTARAGRAGESISITTASDVSQWFRVYKAAGIEKSRLVDVSPGAFELTAAREAARLAADLETKIHRTRKERSDKTWLRRTADEAELVLSEDEEDPDEGKKLAPRRALWGLYRQLLARVRRLPKRQGGAPLPRWRRRR